MATWMLYRNKGSLKWVMAALALAPAAPGCHIQPKGGARTGVLTPSALRLQQELAVPIYPGAVPFTSQDGADFSAANLGAVKGALLRTTDSPSVVVDFYRSHLTDTSATGSARPPLVTEMELDQQPVTTISAQSASGRTVLVEVRREGNGALLQIMSLPGGQALPAGAPGGRQQGQ